MKMMIMMVSLVRQAQDACLPRPHDGGKVNKKFSSFI